MSSKGSPTKRRHVSRSSASAPGSPSNATAPPAGGPSDVGGGGSSSVSPKRRKIPEQQQEDSPPSADEINMIISNLALPDSNIQVALDHANHKTSNAEVQAYAKLAGRNWTYYVQTLKVILGRSSEPSAPQQPSAPQVSIDPSSSVEPKVHIDLGPAKVVSRRHASIQYNQDGRYWELTILGRNGVRIDKVSHKEGTTRLFSGNILDIGGVQMMFVLPDVDPKVAPAFYNLTAVTAVTPPPAEGSDQRKSINSASRRSAGGGSPASKVNSNHRKSPSQVLVANVDSTGLVSNIPLDHFERQQKQLQQQQHQQLRQQQQQQQMQHRQQQQPPPEIPITKFENSTVESSEQKHNPEIAAAAATLASAAAAAAAANASSSSSSIILSNMNSGNANGVAYPRGVAMITRPQVRGVLQPSHYIDQDLSADDAKDIKPPYSYATMITQAIMSTEDMMLSLSDIYEWIMSRYSFYRHSKSGWQNSIRHNLSLNKAFEKVPRKAHETGKGMKWQINDQFKEEYIQKANMGKPAKSRSSPGTPRQQVQPFRFHEKSSPQKASSQVSPLPQSSNTSIMNITSAPAGGTVSQPQPLASHPPHPPHLPNSSSSTSTSFPPLPTLNMSQFPILQPPEQRLDEERRLQGGFTTPQKQSFKSGGTGMIRSGYADYSGVVSTGSGGSTITGTAGTTDSGITGGSSVPSPSQRGYLGGTGQISQLEAYTPERGSRGSSIVNQSKSANGSINVNNNGSKSSGRNGNNSAINTSSNINNNNTTTTTTTATTTNLMNQPSGPSPATSGFNQFLGMTPARQTSHLQLAPPSSAQQQQLPSSFMPGSSPAPFWKMTQFSSTPIRSSEFSPSKFSSPPVSSQAERGNDGSDDTIGDLQDVDLTRYGKKKQQLW